MKFISVSVCKAVNVFCFWDFEIVHQKVSLFRYFSVFLFHIIIHQIKIIKSVIIFQVFPILLTDQLTDWPTDQLTYWNKLYFSLYILICIIRPNWKISSVFNSFYSGPSLFFTVKSNSTCVMYASILSELVLH
jgi:hypothetical protein